LWRSTWAPSAARERLAAELYEWVRRDEKYAMLGANVVAELNSESRAACGGDPSPPWLARRMAACMCRDPAQHRYNDEAPICDRA
jgi:hypothetical protein